MLTNSFIKIRSSDKNEQKEILDPETRKKYDELTRFFLKKYMDKRVAIKSLSMDLMRVALGLHRGSYKMAKRFSEEALIRCTEIRSLGVKPYFADILDRKDQCLSSQPKERTAEDVLMYSVLCKNYARKFLS